MTPERERIILHVDMDAFFAAIEQRDNPKIAAKPVIIGADPKNGKGRGVVSTCSYEARKFGIHSAMPIGRAYKLCPKGIYLKPDMRKYSNESRKIFSIFKDYTPIIEMISVDEAFLDITGSAHLFGSAEKLAIHLKQSIKSKTGLNASVGIAPNKFAAKIASDLSKPDGLLEVKNVKPFLKPLDISKIWGIGKKSLELFHKIGVFTIGDLEKRKKDELENIFGKAGKRLWELARGIDERKVESTDEVKSVSNELTFSKDCSDPVKLKNTILRLSEKVSRRLRRKGLKGQTISIKIRTRYFKTYTRAETISQKTDRTDDIYKKSKILFDRFYKNNDKSIRLVGVKVSGFDVKENQYDLFEGYRESKSSEIDKAIDKITDKYGNDIVYRSGMILKKRRQ